MKISIIIPVYNMERYLARCMCSLLEQTYSDREIILVDDGSTDASGRLCDSYACLPGVRVLHKQNQGLGMARNSGMELARGEYIMFVDADDYLGSELLENLAKVAERTHADLVIGGYTIVGLSTGETHRGFPQEQMFSTQEDMKELLFHTLGAPPEDKYDSKYGLCVWSRLYRRSILEMARLRFVSERELISEDLIFNMDFLHQASSAVLTTDTSYFYCTNPGSLSKQHRADRFAQDLILYRAVQKRLLQYPKEEYRLSLHRLLISRARYDIMLDVDYHDLSDPSYPLKEKTVKVLRAPELRKALVYYPWWRLPLMQGVFTWFMRRQQVWALLILIRLKRRFLPGVHG